MESVGECHLVCLDSLITVVFVVTQHCWVTTHCHSALLSDSSNPKTMFLRPWVGTHLLEADSECRMEWLERPDSNAPKCHEIYMHALRFHLCFHLRVWKLNKGVGGHTSSEKLIVQWLTSLTCSREGTAGFGFGGSGGGVPGLGQSHLSYSGGVSTQGELCLSQLGDLRNTGGFSFK